MLDKQRAVAVLLNWEQGDNGSNYNDLRGV